MAAEWNASTLREKYGEPLARETFQVRPSIEMLVNYGPSCQVCSIELPQSAAKRQLEEVIDELVPPSVRGKETGRSRWIFGGYSISVTRYEHVTISERMEATAGPGVTITFNQPDCP